MKKLGLYAVAAATIVTFVAPSHATPVDGPAGRKCGFNSATDVTREAGWQTGDINAGPLAATVAGTLHCKVVVNNGNRHNSPFVVHESVHTDVGAPVMEPRALNYPATAADDISLCTSWDPDDGDPIYWVSENPTPSNNFSTGHWDNDPASGCGVALSVEPNDPECSIWKAIDRRLGTNIAEIWQDCEPYEEFPLPI